MGFWLHRESDGVVFLDPCEVTRRMKEMTMTMRPSRFSKQWLWKIIYEFAERTKKERLHWLHLYLLYQYILYINYIIETYRDHSNLFLKKTVNSTRTLGAFFVKFIGLGGRRKHGGRRLRLRRLELELDLPMFISLLMDDMDVSWVLMGVSRVFSGDWWWLMVIHELLNGSW
jgi:hypothetical protein